MKLILSLLFLSLYSIFSLNHQQMKSITRMIQKNTLTINQKNIINKVLYKSYEKWAISQAYQFKKQHSYKCRNIDIQELILSSKIGLYKSIVKYNGNSSFLYFTQSFYIKPELLQILNEYHLTSNIPQYIRIRNQYKNKILLQPKFLSISSDELNDHPSSIPPHKTYYYNKINNIWNLIDNLSPFLKKYFHLKFDYEMNSIRTNKEVSILLSCSEENIRKKLIKIKKDFIHDLHFGLHIQHS